MIKSSSYWLIEKKETGSSSSNCIIVAVVIIGVVLNEFGGFDEKHFHFHVRLELSCQLIFDINVHIEARLFSLILQEAIRMKF